jgi:hypothetical protein
MRCLLSASLILAVTVLSAFPASAAVPTLKVVSRAADGTPLVANWTVGGRPPKVLPPPNPIVGPASAGGRKILSGVPS